jgi:phage tail P2-like protein
MIKPLLPPNSTNLEKALAAAVQLPALETPYRALWNPDLCPLALLPWLAWALSIDDWSSDWSEAVKRQRIRTAVDIHKTKGTKSSIESIIATLGGNIAMTEWWETTPKGTPHTFEIVLTASGSGGEAAPADIIEEMIAEVRRTKPLRSHFTLTEGVASVGSLGLVARARPAIARRLEFQTTA